MHKYESKSRITVDSVRIETSYTSSRTPTHDTVMLPLLTEVCGVFNDWLNAHSWQDRIQHVIVKKTRQDVTPYFCVIPASHVNVLITRKYTMNSILEILNKSFSWINTNKYQSLIHISHIPNFRMFLWNSYSNAWTRHALSLASRSSAYEYFNRDLISSNVLRDIAEEITSQNKNGSDDQ